MEEPLKSGFEAFKETLDRVQVQLARRGLEATKPAAMAWFNEQVFLAWREAHRLEVQDPAGWVTRRVLAVLDAWEAEA